MLESRLNSERHSTWSFTRTEMRAMSFIKACCARPSTWKCTHSEMPATSSALRNLQFTNDPNSHPQLHRFLLHVSGFDSVDDESKTEMMAFPKDSKEPAKRRSQMDFYGKKISKKTFSEPLIFLLHVLHVCKFGCVECRPSDARLNTFPLRPHCGEAGAVSHLSIGFLTSESIAHGIKLAMSPMSNNNLFLTYERNPMPVYLKQGLNVSLSTDDPLQFHLTKEPLMEEYSIARQLWKLTFCDMCELAKNSILQSGFEDDLKMRWLGPGFKEEGVIGNDIACSNVPDVRVSFRHETLVNELINLYKAKMLPK
ncbi:hypothetical protein niasHT_040072 [Heterodera trifolii]|uniref:AMP deaminase n=1 Tax=Heterodera trifolii TaxID=157864 RepID=A0ABD2J673_9BILA